MKKLTFIAAVVALTTVVSHAQGLVAFINTSAAGSKISTNSVAGGAQTGLTPAVANQFYYALYSATPSTTTVQGSTAAWIPGASGSVASTFGVLGDASWTFRGYATNTATVGRLQGVNPLAITGVAGGGTANFVVLGWSANLGADIASLQSSLTSANWSGLGFIGESAVGATLTLGDGGSIPTPGILAASGAVTGFTVGIIPVPEPSTMALAALGGASLLLFRRRK